MKKHAKKIITALLVITLLVPTVAMLVSNAAEVTYVELAFNNVFVFEKWANNSLSSTALFQGTPVGKDDTSKGTITTDIQNGSFTLTKNDMTADTELYTAFSMNSENAAANEDYYMMEVEPNTSYTFTYNVSGTIFVFTPYVFMYTDEGLYLENSLVPYATPGYGVNSFSFTTPANVKYIQVRFTVGDNSTNHTGVDSVYATVSDIAIYKTELYDTYLANKNLFSLADWASNEATATSPSGNLGTITTDVDNGKITMVNSGTGYLWTGFGIDTDNSNDQYYTMDVAASTSYTLTYDLVDQNLLGPIYLQPFIVEMDSDGKCLTYYPNQTASLSNKFAFTTQATTARIQLVFALITDGDNTASADSPRYCTIDNIGIYKSTDFTVSFETITGTPHRQTYTASTGTYGELPTPTTTPEGMVFAGWYTGLNGTGEYISADTDVSYQSYTVYAKYEMEVDTLEVSTMPSKTTYTLGEKFNPDGLVLKAGFDNDNDGTVDHIVHINNGYRCEPEYLTATGEQTITVYYGGKTATFTVTVNASETKNVSINNVATDVEVANNKYALEYSTTAFNRYELTYYSDSYVKGVITFDGPDGDTEEFFLEPSNNGSFASYIDGFLRGVNHYGVWTVEFTCLNKEFGKFELYSLATISTPVPSNTVQYFENDKYKVGIDLAFGGVISYIECLEGSTASSNTVMAAQYTDSNGNVYTKVDYEDKLPAGAIATVESVNLINTNDRGRYLQQSYYGTDQAPFVMGDYNGVPWNYNPVQGGNLQSTITGNGGEASKVIDYRITATQIYVKTRPLDWGKNSVDYGENLNDEAWNTPSYMEAWYTFTSDDSATAAGLIQGTCRFVDYSGYPANTTTQEFPALYTVEPLNHFVYNNVDESDAWDATQTEFKNDDYDTENAEGSGAINIEEPDFWGVLPSYNQYNPNGEVDPNVVANEHWAAFTASEDKDSFGIGIYSPGVSDIHYGCFIAKYEENQYKAAGEQGAETDGGYITALKNGTQGSYDHVENFRHANTLDPAVELHTSYIAPIETLTFESYTPITYTYYVSTGTADEIREDFRYAKESAENAQKEVTKVAVPETVYMTPVAADATYTTVGQYYVNNTINDFNNIETVAESNDNMYVGLYALNAKTFTVKVTNATNPSDDIELYNLTTNASAEGITVTYPAGGTYHADNTYGLRFTGTGLKHGEMATAKWEITVTLEDDTTKTYTAYTVLYAPERTVGAVAEGRYNSNSMSEISSWITGATGVNHSQRAPLGSFHGDIHDSGYFIQDPLVYGYETAPTISGSAENSHDYINTDYPNEIGSADNTDDYSDNAYVLQTATHDSDSSRSQSYLGLLAIDKSRYSNTNQIPNLRIGYDALRVGSGAPKDSLSVYNTYYTLGTETAFTSTDLSATPSGWTTHESYSELASSKTIPYRTSVVPAYTVSDSLDGQYIHAIAYGKSYNLFGSKYATAGTSVLLSVTDKSELRDAVTNGYSVTDGTPLFNEKLEDAATVLGDPTATQEEIDNAVKELNDALKFALKYDNLFSALEFSQHPSNMTMSQAASSVSYSDGTLTVTNETMSAGETYTKYASSSDYYKIALEPNTEYVFEYDVTTTAAAQAFLFFYNSSGANSEPATNISVQTDRNGTWASKTEANSWIGNYLGSAATKHYAIKFTTGATTTQVGFRFGNTSSSATTSTFSNIRLIDSERYYSDATYSKTEAAYPKQTAYASLITPTRPGYTFVEWVDAAGNTVLASDIATDHLSVFSVWTANTYTITYNVNGGSVSPTSQSYTPDDSVTLPTPSRNGYLFQGWKVTATDGSWKVNDIYQASAVVKGLYGNTTLTAQWGVNKLTAYFDTILDFSKWNTTTASNATFSNVTDNGFTLTSNATAGEGTSESPEFPVTAGKQYYVDIDFTGTNWDVYIFFRSETVGGTGINFQDGTNRFSSDGAGNQTRTFTAPEGATKAVIRVDANGSNNSVTFSDIRVYEEGTREANVNVPYSSKEITYDSKFGTLPVPTKEGYTFLGWFDGDTEITSDTIVTQTSDVYLKSKWVINDSALVSDTVVIDFAKPIEITPLANDTAYDSAEGEKTFLGITADGTSTPATSLTGTYGTFTVSGEKVTYKPTTAVNGTDVIYYHASVTDANGTTNIKNEIVVVPASNILYEEDKFTVANASGVEWESTAPAGTGNQDAAAENDIYGYDSSYNKIENYSNSSALSVTVNSKDKRSQNIAFTFEGTGFDLNSACGPNTGVMIVSLRDNNYVNTEGKTQPKIIKSYIVDTYYGDYDDENVSRYGDTLYQIPIISETALSHSNYTIQIVASWLPSMSGALNTNSVSTQTLDNGMTVNIAEYANSEELREALADIGMGYVLDAEDVSVVWFDEDSVLNGGEGAETVEDGMLETQSVTELVNVVDSVRVYNPITDGDQYYIDSEKGVAYYNVINNLTTKDSFLSGVSDLFAYIMGTDNQDITVENYSKIGPKDELYLASGTGAVTFTINNLDKTKSKVMISLRAASGKNVVVSFGNENNRTITSSTEMYYDITDYVNNDGTVVIQNKTPGTLLSVGSVKLSGVVQPAMLKMFNLDTAFAMLNAPVEPDVEEPETTVPDVTEPETTVPDVTEPETTVPDVTEPETTVPDITEPEDTTAPSEPEDTTDSNDSEETTNPDGSDEPADPDDSTECWLVRLIKWIVSMFKKIFSAINSILGF